MAKIKLFYSYSHIDEEYRKELEKHLASLKNQEIIVDWHDRRIDAGDDWDEEIERNMDESNVILLLFSPDFIASNSCQKEVKKALKLRKDNQATVIPIILRKCAWQDVIGIPNIQALPKDGKSIKLWEDSDSAWHDVYSGIKKKVEKIRKNILPEIKKKFRDSVVKNPLFDANLDQVFVFPDILREGSEQYLKLEDNELDSKKLENIENFSNKFILIEGEEQSGKSS